MSPLSDPLVPTVLQVVDERPRVSVSDQQPLAVIQLIDQRPRVSVEQTQLTIVSVGTQGPPGPAAAVIGAAGDVFFNSGTSSFGVDTGVFRYSQQEQALEVPRLSGTILDGGNF